MNYSWNVSLRYFSSRWIRAYVSEILTKLFLYSFKAFLDNFSSLRYGLAISIIMIIIVYIKFNLKSA